jgi:hypothetical protein
MLRPYQLRICVDWPSTAAFLPPSVHDHPSCFTVGSLSRQPETLERCLDRRFEADLGDTCCSCLEEGKTKSHEIVANAPERIIVQMGVGRWCCRG